MPSVKRNIIANYLGGVWAALMGFAFIPLYINYLGIEAYGLIGVFAVLQAWLTLLDMGLTPMLSREMARFKADAYTSQSIHDLIRSVEWIYGLIAAAIVVGITLSATWLANDWLRNEGLSKVAIEEGLVICGVVIGVRWMGGLYRSAISGLQHQVWLNVCTAFFSTMRGLGVVAVLVWLSATIQAFFIYQGVIAALEVLVLAIQMRRLLPKPPESACFRWGSLRQAWRFAAGMTAVAALAVLLTQVDKLLLSKLVSLTEFGYYTLASMVAGALYMVVGPISVAAYPKLTELVERGESKKVIETYHKLSQLLTLIVVPIALVLSFFSEHVMLLWTRDSALTTAVAPLVSLLVIGTMLNGLMHIPYNLQLAHGWTRFAVIVNSVSVLILVPAIYFGVSKYGAIASAIVWLILNIGYIAFALPFMHRKLLPTELWRWYRQDVFVPAFSALAMVSVARVLAPSAVLERPLVSIVILATVGVVALVTATVATPLGRTTLRHYLQPIFSKHELY